MTKIHKISKDLYEFINEDTGTSFKCDANIAAQTQVKINKSVEERNKEKDKHITHTFWELENGFRTINIDEFKRFLKSIKSHKEVQIPTGCMIFSEDKYNAKQKSITDRKTELVKQFNNIANDITMNVMDKAKALMPIRKEINELNSVIILKDAKEFEEVEYITVKIKPVEAYETYLKLIERHDTEDARLKQEAIDKVIKEETLVLKDVDDDDFVLLKHFYKWVNKGLLNNITAYSEIEAYATKRSWKDIVREAVTYESKEVYLNRPRNPQYESYKITFTQEEAQSVLYLSNLRKEFINKQTEKRLQEEAESLTKSYQS